MHTTTFFYCKQFQLGCKQILLQSFTNLLKCYHSCDVFDNYLKLSLVFAEPIVFFFNFEH